MREQHSQLTPTSWIKGVCVFMPQFQSRRYKHAKTSLYPGKALHKLNCVVQTFTCDLILIVFRPGTVDLALREKNQ